MGQSTKMALAAPYLSTEEAEYIQLDSIVVSKRGCFRHVTWQKSSVAFYRVVVGGFARIGAANVACDAEVAAELLSRVFYQREEVVVAPGNPLSTHLYATAGHRAGTGNGTSRD